MEEDAVTGRGYSPYFVSGYCATTGVISDSIDEASYATTKPNTKRELKFEGPRKNPDEVDYSLWGMVKNLFSFE